MQRLFKRILPMLLVLTMLFSFVGMPLVYAVTGEDGEEPGEGGDEGVATPVTTVLTSGTEINPFSGGYISVTDINQLQATIDYAQDGDGLLLYFASELTLPATLTINKSLSFWANGELIIYPPAGQRHINVSGGDVELMFGDVVLDGNTSSTGTAQGGIKSTAASLTLEGANIQNCKAVNYGGAVECGVETLNLYVLDSDLTGNSAPAQGGGIYTTGSAEIHRSTFRENKSLLAVVSGGGAIACEGEFLMTDSIFTGNEASVGGGAVYTWNHSNTTISGCTFTDNVTAGAGGALYGWSALMNVSDSFFINNEADVGGVIYNVGSTIASNSEFIGNTGGWGGAICGFHLYTSYFNPTECDGTVTVENCLFEGNTSTVEAAGAIYAEDAMSVTGSRFINNESGRSGGALYGNTTVYVNSSDFTGNQTKNHNGSSWSGGAIRASGAITVVNGSTFTENTATWNGGAISGGSTVNVSDSTFTDNASVGAGGGAIYSNSTATVTDCIFEGNRTTTGAGGALYANATASISGSEFTENVAGADYGGGAIYAYNTLSILNGSVFTGNKAGGHGGAIRGNWHVLVNDSTLSDNETPMHGGAICVWNSGGVITIDNSEISNNRAGVVNGYNGGGICSAGSIVVKDGSVISGNTAGGNGGGFYVYSGTATITGSEISENAALTGVGGAIYMYAYDKLTVGDDVEFSENTSTKPRYYNADLLGSTVMTYYNANIKPASISSYVDADNNELQLPLLLNNYDVNYTVPGTYDVTYEDGDPTTVDAGEIVTVLSRAAAGVADKAHYDFLGWSTDSDAEDAEYEAGELLPVVSNLTLYGVWQEEGRYSVTYDDNGADDGDVPVDTSTYYANGSVTPLGNTGALEKDHYDFLGWSIDSDAVEPDDTFTMEVGGLTLYAVWQEHAKYTVSFELNGGTGNSTTVSQTVYTGETATRPATNPSRSDYSFGGWYADVLLTTQFNYNTPVVESIVIYARWVYSGGGGTINPPYVNPPPVVVEDDETPLTSGTLDRSKRNPYIKGYPDGTFHPEDDITRAEVAVIFYRLLLDEDKELPLENIFSDIVGNEWYAHEVNYLASIGIITGYPDGTFGGDKTITRAEFATVASRFDNLETSEISPFSDVTYSHWAGKYILSAYVKGWVAGYPDGTFKPDANITRAEVVKIINTMLDRITTVEDWEGIECLFSDIDSRHWAYHHVMEASIEEM